MNTALQSLIVFGPCLHYFVFVFGIICKHKSKTNSQLIKTFTGLLDKLIVGYSKTSFYSYCNQYMPNLSKDIQFKILFNYHQFYNSIKNWHAYLLSIMLLCDSNHKTSKMSLLGLLRGFFLCHVTLSCLCKYRRSITDCM